MSQTIFVVRAKQVSGACIVYRTRSRLHNSLTPFRFFFIGFVSANSEKTEIETWNREASMHGKPIHDGADRDEKEIPWKANEPVRVI
jgi:hypothetical protein